MLLSFPPNLISSQRPEKEKCNKKAHPSILKMHILHYHPNQLTFFFGFLHLGLFSHPSKAGSYRALHLTSTGTLSNKLTNEKERNSKVNAPKRSKTKLTKPNGQMDTQRLSFMIPALMPACARKTRNPRYATPEKKTIVLVP